MRILLDTSYLYDLMDAPGKFSEVEHHFLEMYEARFYASAVSIWEMRLKYRARRSTGERKSRFAPDAVVDALDEQNVEFLALTIRHAAQELETPIAHKDPFDELLLVQAQEESLKLLTTDRLLAEHPLAITV